MTLPGSRQDEENIQATTKPQACGDKTSATVVDQLNVYMHATHGQIDKVRAFAASCTVKDAERVRWLEKVDAADSVARLARIAATAPEETADAEVSAMALHAEDSATATLVHLADSTRARKLREQALFWLGQARGIAGAHYIEHVATTDADPDLRANAVSFPVARRRCLCRHSPHRSERRFRSRSRSGVILWRR